MSDRQSRIAALNDRVRLGRDPNARIVMTATCLAALAGDDRPMSEVLAQAKLLSALRHYVFQPDDGGERARGAFAIGPVRVRFTIDYYHRSLEWGSDDPADPEQTTRVLTVMLPSDD